MIFTSESGDERGSSTTGAAGALGAVGRVDTAAVGGRFRDAHAALTALVIRGRGGSSDVDTTAGPTAGPTALDAGPDAGPDADAVSAVVVALAASAGDVPVLLVALRAARLRAANLEAAGRATLAADRDGESDPLYYLRDELTANHPTNTVSTADGPAGAGSDGGVGWVRWCPVTSTQLITAGLVVAGVGVVLVWSSGRSSGRRAAGGPSGRQYRRLVQGSRTVAVVRTAASAVVIVGVQWSVVSLTGPSAGTTAGITGPVGWPDGWPVMWAVVLGVPALLAGASVARLVSVLHLARTVRDARDAGAFGDGGGWRR